ncbi:MAG TPA: hypothetical protein VFA98_11265 [Thermoanaerobaculia bacterium]|nr:hypothetical protein [Thermoanaerobaculia bacterium]
MRAFGAIVRREILERRAILYAAAAAALGPMVLPLIRSGSRHGAAELRASAAFLIGIAFALGFAIALGSSLLVPRISSRRVGFDFARPLSGSSLWFGSVAATSILALSAAAIVWLPAWVVGTPNVWSELVPDPEQRSLSAIGLLLVVPLLFSAVHGLTLILRSRSTLLVLDALLCGAVALGVAAATSRLPEFLAPGPRIGVILSLAGAAGVAFLVAGQASVSDGRTDIRAAHRAFSTVLWTILVAAAVLANLYSIWVMSAGPSTVVTNGFWFRPADVGPWVEISGHARGARAELLYDTATGRFERTRTVDWRGPALSGNGRRAAWIEGGDRGAPSHPLRIRALDDPGARPVATRLLIEGYPSLLELSEDGSRLATWENGVLAVHDIASERTLVSASVPIGEREEIRGLFVSPDVFRAYRVGDRRIEILQLDAATRKLERLGSIEGLVGRYFVTDASGSRLLKVGGGVRLYDGATGSLLATLAEGPHRFGWAAMLPDRRVVMTEERNGLRVFDENGREQATIALPPDCSGRLPVSKVTIGGEVALDRLVVGCTDDLSKRTLWLADFRDGSIRRVADGLSPFWAFGARPALGSDATKLFYGDDARSLVRFDPLTGERRVILGRFP